ncbi:BolA family protein [Uliginosibacterium sp. 31-16]|uniref:BolA family protein n=1 Tax=Uliginosibacterium sp. 31-16 TaxID=3068315 RepID=UPI00273E8886|nr:BolA family protein [Uliginosibacterium sp. 31-16]MDP5239559.1 BolA family protein [Uliginosibacterium sp. 31-16]
MLTRDLLLEHLASLQPVLCELTDESHLHVGHAGAKGGGHYRLKIVAEAFAGRSAVARHRLVYASLGTLMRGEVHALSITALTPEENQPDQTA